MSFTARSFLLCCCAGLLGLTACSSSAKKSESAPPTTVTSTTRPYPVTGPAAVVSGPITGPGPLVGSDAGLAAVGYSESEYFVEGTATSYKAVGAQGDDGKWTLAAKDRAKYRTRIIVRRPADAAKFNGTVIVEWLNVSAGAEGAADFLYMRPEILRSGYAWVGVSAQITGVSGGTAVVPVAGVPQGGIKAANPARYASLHHPGDAYAFDMYSQIGRALRTPGAIDPLAGLHPAAIDAMGESQSAFELTTYIDGFAPATKVYDGYFVHSRGGGAIALAGGDIASGIAGRMRIRTDLDVPVLMVETEGDEGFLGYFHARQPDTAHIRLWDVAGAAHADAYLVQGHDAAIGCGARINAAQTHFVLNAALEQLGKWVKTGTPPPPAPRMRMTVVSGTQQFVRDAHGNTLDGVRTPALDVPVAAYTGVAEKASILCLLFGSTTPFDAAMLKQLYTTKADYVAAYTKATDRAIAAGFMLAADRAEILAQADKVSI